MAEKKAEEPADKLIVRAFGPFADAFGKELAKFPPVATQNLLRFAEKFRRKTKSSEREATSLRLFHQIIEEAAWSDESIVAEYLSGVLAASSKSIISDRGVTIAALVRRLSSQELRLHYLLYGAMLGAIGPRKHHDFRLRVNMVRLHCEVELDELFLSLEMPQANWDERKQVLDHAVLGLAREDLIARDQWWYNEDQSYLEFHPTALGAELLLWGAGSVVIDHSRFFDPALELVIEDDPAPLRTVRIGNPDELINFYDVEMYESISRRDPGSLLELATAFVEHNPDRANGHFYLAIANTLSGADPDVELMSRAGVLASGDMISSGLTTLDFVAIQFPSRQVQVRELAATLESVAREKNRAG
jgi:hypothetical protein